MSNVPKLRFQDSTGVWSLSSLGNYFEFRNGINATKEQYGKGYKFINVLDIINNSSITHDKIIGSVDVSETVFKRNIVEYGDVLFQRSSETRDEAGQSNVYLDKNTPATFGGFVIRGKGKRDYDPVFFNHLLKSSKARKEITTKSNGSTRYNVGQETLSEVELHIPALSEQQKIAAFLTAVDTKIEQLAQKEALLKQYKKGVMQKIFSQEIRFKADDGSEFPEWVERRISELTIKKTSTLVAGTIEDNTGTYPVYGATGFIKLIDFYTEEEPYISIVKDGAGVGRVLLCAPKSTVLGTLDIIKSAPEVNLYFILMLLERINFTKYVTGSTIPHIYYKDYSAEKVNVPTLAEQNKIAHYLSALDDKLAQVSGQIEAARTFKKGLLQQMFV